MQAGNKWPSPQILAIEENPKANWRVDGLIGRSFCLSDIIHNFAHTFLPLVTDVTS